jgi:hypothetical protein
VRFVLSGLLLALGIAAFTLWGIPHRTPTPSEEADVGASRQPAALPAPPPSLPQVPGSVPSAATPDAGAGVPIAAAPDVPVGQSPAAAHVSAAAHVAAARANDGAHLDEAHLMERLRGIKDSDLSRAVDLAREGNRRFPNSHDAPERASILVHALAGQDKPSEARGEAEFMVNHYADSTWVREVEQFTGAHRHRNIRVTDAGVVQYE